MMQMTAEMQANPRIFSTVHRLKLISIKNLPIFLCKKYLLSTNGLILELLEVVYVWRVYKLLVLVKTFGLLSTVHFLILLEGPDVTEDCVTYTVIFSCSFFFFPISFRQSPLSNRATLQVPAVSLVQ
jgi:hypothetical protein